MMDSPSLPDSSRVAAIIVAAGGSTRMGGVDKTQAMLLDAPLIAHTVDVFESCSSIGAIVLMVAEANEAAIAALCRERGWTKVAAVRRGGTRRQDTVRLGLQALPVECEWVLVHDGARPMVTAGMVEIGLEAALETGAAVAAVPAKDTIKAVEGAVVERTLDRANLVHVQTPQVFRRDLLERAHREVTDDITDDAAMMESMGVTVKIFLGDYSNIKVTTPEDLTVAEALLLARGKG